MSLTGFKDMANINDKQSPSHRLMKSPEINLSVRSSSILPPFSQQDRLCVSKDARMRSAVLDHVEEHSSRHSDRCKISFPVTPTTHLSSIENATAVLNECLQYEPFSREKKIDELREKMLDPGLGALADFLATKDDSGFELMGNKIGNSKRSLSYDFRNNVEQLNLAVVAESNAPITSWADIFDTDFSIETLEEFQKFEEAMNICKQNDDSKKAEAQKKQSSLRKRFKNQLGQIGEFSKCVNAIITQHLHRDVQLLYSGQGRVTKNNVPKLAYNKTVSFSCMKAVLLEKFPTPPSTVLTATSNFLANAPARKHISVDSNLGSSESHITP